jgi:hypothetical protein
MRILASAAFVFAIAAPAAAQDNPACAKFDEPLAYNNCLARLGPQAHAVQGGPEPGEGGARDRVHQRLWPQAARRVHGRMRMEFNVTPR